MTENRKEENERKEQGGKARRGEAESAEFLYGFRDGLRVFGEVSGRNEGDRRADALKAEAKELNPL